MRDVVDESSSVVVGTIIWSTAHAEALEYGTEKMEPRPFVRPALANKKDEIVSDIAAEVRSALR